MSGLLLLIPFSMIYGQEQGSPDGAGRGIVALLDKTWGVQLDLSGFTITFSGMKPDGRRYLVANNNATGVMASMTLEEMASYRTVLTCKDIMNSRVANNPENNALAFVAGEEKKDNKIWQDGDKTYQEYRIPSITPPGGKRIDINQRNRFLCMQHDNVFIDFHISKANFQAGEEKLFDPIFNSVAIREGLARTSMDYFQAATAYYTNNDFKRAIPSYAQALEMEQHERKLEKHLWYVLVDNLGMAYGVTGDLDAARKTFEYGIQIDPGYPLFYYEMADYFAEKNDELNALAYLQKAFERRANFLPGEKFPDPHKDDSFKKLMKNREFRDAVDSLLKGI